MNFWPARNHTCHKTDGENAEYLRIRVGGGVLAIAHDEGCMNKIANELRRGSDS